MIAHKDATFYAQVEPVWSWWKDSNGEQDLQGAKVVAITQKRPSKPRSGVVITKLTIRIPDSAFLPLRPEAIVVIPENMTAASPLEVLAEDANA